MNITAEQIRLLAPRAAANAKQIADALSIAMRQFDIIDRLRTCHFIGQLIHESGQFTRTRESFNYTPEAILQTFNTVRITRFSVDQARSLGRNPARPANQERIANIAYANRMGNGDIASGDGCKFAGRGWLQLTGKTNHQACAEAFGLKLDAVGEWLCTPGGAALGAAWFWHTNGLNRHADRDDVDAISDLVNMGRRTEKIGDANGFRDRLAATEHCKRVIK